MSIQDSIVEYAESLKGKVQYVFGANDPKNLRFDCSSFVQYVYKQNGINIGRDTLSQVTDGKSVAKLNLEKGDLVFFKGTYREGVSHVGIYIGGGQFIHNSSTADDVKISKLSDPYWIEHWYGARRFVDSSANSGIGNGYNEVTGEWEIKDGTEPHDDSWLENKISDFMNKYIKKFSVGVLMVIVVVLAMFFVYMALGNDLKQNVTEKAVNTIVGA